MSSDSLPVTRNDLESVHYTLIEKPRRSCGTIRLPRLAA